jgi:valyl-tRNA synthetase
LRERGKRIDEISAEEFLEYCTNWKDQRITDISAQLKQMFVSLDWNGYIFYTMDEVSFVFA